MASPASRRGSHVPQTFDEQQLANSLRSMHLDTTGASSSASALSPSPSTSTSASPGGRMHHSYTPRTKSSLSRQTSMTFPHQQQRDGSSSAASGSSANGLSTPHNTGSAGTVAAMSSAQRQRSTPTTPTIRKQQSLSNIAMGHSANNTPRRSLSRQSSLLLSRSPSSLGNNNNVQQSERYPLSPPVSNTMAPTVVILHDSSYKHRYLRPGSKADLQSVVERPERIPAAVLGICAAQTRLGQELVTIQKSRRQGGLFDSEVRLVHGGEGGSFAWPEELAVLCREAGAKLKSGECEVPDKFHQGDLYLCPDSREDLEGCIGAMYDGVDAVFSKPAFKSQKPTRRAFVCIRPPGHHCAETEPSGFCWINNVHIGIAHAAKVHGLTHAVILDFDLHHGDGSQSITWTMNDLHNQSRKPNTIPQIAYFSLHDINSYPCEVGDMEKVRNASVQLNAHGQCIYNIHLESYSTEEQFWELYENRYSIILTKAREYLVASMQAFKAQKANAKREARAAIFLSAGFDASEHEGASMQRHKVHVPTDFFARFTRDAVAIAEDKSTGCDGRVISVLEGGYSNRAITSGVFAHVSGLATAPSRLDGPLGAYESSWWDLNHLMELEKFEKKGKRRQGNGLHYLAATASSAAKAVHSPRSPGFRDTASPAPPKPIFVDWATATWELSHRHIPREEELATTPIAEQPPSPTESTTSVRTSKRERHSVIGVGGEAVEIIGGSRRTLRERKARPEPIVEESSRASRRKTVAVTERSSTPSLTTVTKTATKPANPPPFQLQQAPPSRPQTAASQTSNTSSVSSRATTPAQQTSSNESSSAVSKLSSAGPGPGVAASRRPATAMAREPRSVTVRTAGPARPTTSASNAHPTSQPLRRKPSTTVDKKLIIPQRKASTANLKTSQSTSRPAATPVPPATTTKSVRRAPAGGVKREPILPPPSEASSTMDQLTDSLSNVAISAPPAPSTTYPSSSYAPSTTSSTPPITTKSEPSDVDMTDRTDDDLAIRELEANIAAKQAELEAVRLAKARQRAEEKKRASLQGQQVNGFAAQQQSDDQQQQQQKDQLVSPRSSKRLSDVARFAARFEAQAQNQNQNHQNQQTTSRPQSRSHPAQPTQPSQLQATGHSYAPPTYGPQGETFSSTGSSLQQSNLPPSSTTERQEPFPLPSPATVHAQTTGGGGAEFVNSTVRDFGGDGVRDLGVGRGTDVVFTEPVGVREFEKGNGGAGGKVMKPLRIGVGK